MDNSPSTLPYSAAHYQDLTASSSDESEAPPNTPLLPTPRRPEQHQQQQQKPQQLQLQSKAVTFGFGSIRNGKHTLSTPLPSSFPPQQVSHSISFRPIVIILLGIGCCLLYLIQSMFRTYLSPAEESSSSLTASSSSYTSYPCSPAGSSLSPSVTPLNLHNFARVLERLHLGLPIVVGLLGGSNSLPLQKDAPDSFGNIFVEWLNDRFPVNETAAEEEDRTRVSPRATYECDLPTHPPLLHHKLERRAVGGTGSGPPSFCIRSLFGCPEPGAADTEWQLDGVHPDLVLVEYALNDVDVSPFWDPKDGPFDVIDNMERLTRQLLGPSFSRTALLHVYLASGFAFDLRSAQNIHQTVADHYHIPSVSLKDFFDTHLFDPKLINKNTYGRVVAPLLKLPGGRAQGLQMVADRFNISHDQAFFRDWVHINEVGQYEEQKQHRIRNNTESDNETHNSIHIHMTLLYFRFSLYSRLTSQLLIQLVERFYFNYVSSGFTSLSDRLTRFPYASLSGHPLPHILSVPPMPLEPAINPFLQSSSEDQYFCKVLYHPFNPRSALMSAEEAQNWMGVVVQDSAWVYGGPVEFPEKRSIMISSGMEKEIGQHLILKLTQPVKSTLVIMFIRSWNREYGVADVYLSCSIKPLPLETHVWGSDPTDWNQNYFLHHDIDELEYTPRVRVSAQWETRSTQASQKLIWPLPNDALVSAFGSNVTKSNQEEKTDSQLNTENRKDDVLYLNDIIKKKIKCPLQYLHVELVVAGKFQFIGYFQI